MKELNVVVVYDRFEEFILMCRRVSDPYEGKYNLVGGKVEPKEDPLTAAYRELYEETNIAPVDIDLSHALTFEYPTTNVRLYVYSGVLKTDPELVEEKHPLEWVRRSENFFDLKKYAGEGNIGHMLEIVDTHREKVLKK